MDGEYVIRVEDPSYPYLADAQLPGVYSDTSLTFDVRLVGDASNRFIAAGCRQDQALAGEYSVYLFPSSRALRIWRGAGSGSVVLFEGPSAAIRRDNATNHVELGCAGDTISVSINGSVVAAVQDGTYRSGTLWIGVRASDNDVAEARYDNLVLRQTPSGTPSGSPSPTPARTVPAPTSAARSL